MQSLQGFALNQKKKKKGNQTVVNFAGVDKCAEKGGANDKGFRELRL